MKTTSIFLKKTTLFLFAAFLSFGSIAQPESAIMDIESTTHGVLIPRMTSAQRVAINGSNPATGLLVFDTNTASFWFYNGTQWENLSAGAGDADADPTNEIQSLSLTDNELSISGANSVLIPLGPIEDTGDNPTAFPIADNPIDDAISTITLASSDLINPATEIQVCLDLDYAWLAEIDVILIAPDGITQILLINNNGPSGQNSYTSTCFSTAASIPIADGTTPFTGTFIPAEPFSTFIGQNAGGTWTLRATDTNPGNGDTGSLNSWDINIKNNNYSTGISDEDGDTKVEMEQNPDEDKIRFTTAGVETMRLETNANGDPVLHLVNPLHRNTMIGLDVGPNVTSFGPEGVDNTFLGFMSGNQTTSGRSNTLIGSSAGTLITTGIQNTLIGTFAGQNNNGEGNTFIGHATGLSNQTGSRNVFIGYKAGNQETGSHRLYIANDNNDSSNALIYGEFDNDNLSLNADVSVRDKLNLSTDGVEFSNNEIINKGTILKYYINTSGTFPTNGASNIGTLLGEIKLLPYLNFSGGWLPCEGQELSINNFQALFSLIGNQYGGNGSSTFKLPDMRNAVPIHN